MAILYHHQFLPKNGKLDVKMLKTLFSTHRRIVTFHIIGDIIWTPTEFLLHLIPDASKVLDKKFILNVAQAKANLLNKQADSLFLTKELQKFQDGFQEWKNEYKTLTENLNSTDTDTIRIRCMCVFKVIFY